MTHTFVRKSATWSRQPGVTQDLCKVLTSDMLSPHFAAKLNVLRATLAAQLASPRAWGGHPLTGPALSKLVPMVCDALNGNGAVMPQSMYESMLQSEASALLTRTEAQLHTTLEGLAAAAGAAGDGDGQAAADSFDQHLIDQCTHVMAEFQAELNKICQDATFSRPHIIHMQDKIKELATRTARRHHRARWPHGR